MTLTLDITRSDKPVSMMNRLTRLISFALFPSTHLISILLLQEITAKWHLLSNLMSAMLAVLVE